MTRRPKAVVFDLGGVVIDIDFSRVFKVWADLAGCDMAQIRTRFRMDHLYQAHEKGQISGAEFFAGLRERLGIDLSDDQFTQGWNAIFVGMIPGMAKLIESTRHKLPVYAFSNTNNIHLTHMTAHYPMTLTLFEEVFISSKMGLRKPDPQAFEWIIEQIKTPGPDILFFDDTLENVKGAEACGIEAVLVKDIHSVIEALHARIA